MENCKYEVFLGAIMKCWEEVENMEAILECSWDTEHPLEVAESLIGT